MQIENRWSDVHISPETEPPIGPTERDVLSAVRIPTEAGEPRKDDARRADE